MPEGTADRLWQRTELDLREREHRMQSTSIADEVTKAEFTWLTRNGQVFGAVRGRAVDLCGPGRQVVRGCYFFPLFFLVVPLYLEGLCEGLWVSFPLRALSAELTLPQNHSPQPPKLGVALQLSQGL